MLGMMSMAMAIDKSIIIMSLQVPSPFPSLIETSKMALFHSVLMARCRPSHLPIILDALIADYEPLLSQLHHLVSVRPLDNLPDQVRHHPLGPGPEHSN